MPTLHWIGKDKVINHHMDVPFKVLEHAYGFDNGTQTEQETNSGNKIIHGDNLEALKALLPEYEGKIKCIYIDPPYNTGNESWVYNDNVNDPKIKKWLGQVVGKESEDLTRHDKWLCMMYPRLKLLHKLLSEDGILLVSIGDDEVHSLGLVLDEIFGRNNQVAKFCWKSRAKPANVGEAKYKPQRVSEYILAYGKKKDLIKYNPIYSGGKRSYPSTNEEGRKYRSTTILKSNRGESKRETMRFKIAGYTPPPGQRWQGGFDLIKRLYDTGYIDIIEGYPSRRYYEDEEPQEHIPFYTFIPPEQSGTAESGKTLLNKILGDQHGFDTVKPVQLIEQFLAAITKDGDYILDSFAGSGTTAHAVLKLNKQEEVRRKFILIQIDETDKKGDTTNIAETITSERVKRVIVGFADEEGTGGSFDFYELGQPMFLEDGNLNELVGVEKIRQYIYYTETKTPLTETKHKDNKHFLGKHNDTVYFFNYEQYEVTTLNHTFLATMHTKAEQYVIYADNCLLTKDFMTKHHIIFKKIPRDITRF